MPSYKMGHVPKSVVVTFCVGYVTSYGRVWFLHVFAESSGVQATLCHIKVAFLVVKGEL